MRRIRLALTLPLLALLLLAQQGALLHVLSHVAYAGQALGAEMSAGGQLLDNDHCLTCQAFAHVAHSASGSMATFVAPAASTPRTLAPPYSVVCAAAPTPRSRGPPQVIA